MKHVVARTFAARSLPIPLRSSARRNGTALVLLGVVLLVVWTEPWKLLARTTSAEVAPVGSYTIAMGTFIGHVHHTVGTARLIAVPGSEPVLRVEGLRTVQGPRVHVWLVARRFDKGTASRREVRNVAHVDLGPLRANLGDAHYLLPANTPIPGVATVILWCARFGVVFGFAPLDTAAIEPTRP